MYMYTYNNIQQQCVISFLAYTVKIVKENETHYTTFLLYYIYEPSKNIT